MTTKTAYQFDLAGLFVGDTVAHESPLEPGVYHIPACCTLDMPPQEWPDDQWPRWNGSAWVLVSRPVPANDNNSDDDAVAKLRAFLAANPDVASLLNSTDIDGVANV